jgi:hypothetical protein
MPADPDAVYATRGLVEALVRFADDADPDGVSIALATTPAGEFADGLPADTPVFTDFYHPEAGRSIQGVFGVDLGRPPGDGGRFVSHPDGVRTLTRADDLAARVLVAVPPWDTEDVVAFDRRGRRRPLTLVDASPPAAELE